MTLSTLSEGSAAGRAKRLQLVARIADRLLEAGVAQVALRELAAQLGTSDRMLLYYFGDKANLLRASLEEVSRRLAERLASSFPDRDGPAGLLRTAIPLFASPELSPFMNVWADISARGGRGEEPFRTLARSSVEQWLAWLDSRLDLAEGVDRRGVAVAVMAAVEGARLMEAAAPGSTRDVATILSRAFVRPA